MSLWIIVQSGNVKVRFTGEHWSHWTFNWRRVSVSSVFQWFQSSQFWWFNSNCFNDSIIPIVWLIPILQTISMIKVIAITRMSSKYPCCYRHCYSNCSNCSNDSTFSWGILDHEVYKLFLLNEGRSELKKRSMTWIYHESQQCGIHNSKASPAINRSGGLLFESSQKSRYTRSQKRPIVRALLLICGSSLHMAPRRMINHSPNGWYLRMVYGIMDLHW